MFITFTKIRDYKSIIGDIIHTARFVGIDESGEPMYDNDKELPTLTFTGTCKLHGTNASVVRSPNGDIYFQSRRAVITPMKDNAGFAFFAKSNESIFNDFFDKIVDRYKDSSDKHIAIFGEWCGGNIQKGVAISGLPKMFVIFAVKLSEEIDGEMVSEYLPNQFWKDLNFPEFNIYNIYDFKTYSIDIDFNTPKYFINKLVEYTLEVEDKCPVGTHFGRSSINGDNVTGEGIVWETWYKGNRIIFKTKGEKHSSSKVKKIVSVDTEKLDSIMEFIDYSVTENRLNQAIEQVFTIRSVEPHKKHTGDFIKWIHNDIIEEESDVLNANGLEYKDVNKEISIKAKNWFFKYLDSLI
ncbi:MAG: RNA ligase family protein [Candidatus Pacearchaeota archaeon]